MIASIFCFLFGHETVAFKQGDSLYTAYCDRCRETMVCIQKIDGEWRSVLHMNTQEKDNDHAKRDNQIARNKGDAEP